MQATLTRGVAVPYRWRRVSAGGIVTTPRREIGNVMASAIARSIIEQLRAETQLDTASLHRLRRGFSRQLAKVEGDAVLEVARSLLVSRVPGSRMVAYGIVGHDPRALMQLDAAELERFGGALQSWGDVDMFGCLLAGRAWRDGAIQDATILGWARSDDRFWRRLALVCTVPLNVKAQGGEGDVKRTLAVCVALVDDRDDLVVKALSWALRELATRDASAVSKFLAAHEDELAARVKREVRNKLTTGRKTPRAD